MPRTSATADVESDVATEGYDEDVSAEVRVFSDDAAVLALRRAGEISLFIDNIASQTTTVGVYISQLLESPTTYVARLYDSQRG